MSDDNKTGGLPVFLTPEQVATALAVKVETVQDWLRRGRLKGLKVGHIWRVRESDFYAFIEHHDKGKG